MLKSAPAATKIVRLSEAFVTMSGIGKKEHRLYWKLKTQNYTENYTENYGDNYGDNYGENYTENYGENCKL